MNVVNSDATDRHLETALTIEAKIGIPRDVLYKLARAGMIPSYSAGPQGTGVRFIAEEVLKALRRPTIKKEVAE